MVRTRPKTFHRRMIRSQVEAYGNTTFYDPIRHYPPGVVPVASFLKKKQNLFYIYKYCLPLHMCTTCVQYLVGPEEGIGSPGVPDSCEPPSWCWELNLLLTTEGSLPPLPVAWYQMCHSELLLYFLKVVPVFPAEWQDVFPRNTGTL